MTLHSTMSSVHQTPASSPRAPTLATHNVPVCHCLLKVAPPWLSSGPLQLAGVLDARLLLSPPAKALVRCRLGDGQLQ
jgi:hypothetical protein